MTSRILVVDDVPANVTLLEARLQAEYFEVLTACNGADALAICARGECDIVLLDVMMPGMDGFEVCRRLKADPATTHIPVVIVSALDRKTDRIEGLRAGADDFLTKPVDDLALLTRVRSLARIKQMGDELRLRASSGEDAVVEALPSDTRGKVIVVDDNALSYERVVRALSIDSDVDVVIDPREALLRIAEDGADLVVVSLALNGFDALRLCSQLRAIDATRALPLLLLATQGEQATVMRGLELGVNDFLMRPIDPSELQARTRTQIRRKRFNDALRDTVQRTMELAVTDGLTGLGNRRQFDRHAGALVKRAGASGAPLTLMMLDIDRFKPINDAHGHPAGDEVLREFARRVRRGIRSQDSAFRIGGEEFAVLMPGTDRSVAFSVAERLRGGIAAHPFLIDGGRIQLDVTVSAGLATLESSDDSAGLLAKADAALYLAKRAGRDRVMAQAA